ncbi:hypothetical protein SEA_GODONK_42 [Gordonia phage GodonK]|uniref:Uncharacterized protein n=1 Tax=Gordonia phage GodonK TaxID=2562192 RepID=A0A4D6E2B9_9CAUD|nr:hypothetical protein HOV33_gp042 [Gordonia phage GodonK]QBZ72661.1 hypothetical protein SEA_GODONK_42 [Gordonia phage GodonK]
MGVIMSDDKKKVRVQVAGIGQLAMGFSALVAENRADDWSALYSSLSQEERINMTMAMAQILGACAQAIIDFKDEDLEPAEWLRARGEEMLSNAYRED